MLMVDAYLRSDVVLNFRDDYPWQRLSLILILVRISGFLSTVWTSVRRLFTLDQAVSWSL
jgi:hypothetical protein